MKKFISIILTVALIICLLPGMTLTASASAPSSQTATISAGDGINLAVKADGSVWAWGQNEFGEIGDGTTTIRYAPVKVMDGAVSVAAGFFRSFAVKSDGSLWAWGNNVASALGDGTTTRRQTPVKIMDGDVVSVTAGLAGNFAIKTDGSLWSWGNLPNHDNSATPVKIMDDVVSVSSAQIQAVVLKTDGSLWTWLNTGPIKIIDDVAAASAGRFHTLALKTDGSVWAWGMDSDGQVGNELSHIFSFGRGTAELRTPVKVMDDVVSISAGEMQGFAIKTDRSLWTWGNKRSGPDVGETRLATTFQHTVYWSAPVKIMDDVVSVSTKDLASFAIKTDGTLWSWGIGYTGTGRGIINEQSDHQRVPIKIMDGVKLPATTTITPPTPANPLDSASSWAREHITTAIAANLVPQNLQSSYTQATTRAEFAALAVAVYESVKGEITGRVTFTDTDDVNVQKMAYLEVVGGVGGNRFDPNGTLTREQAAVMASRLSDAIGQPFPAQASTFADNGAASSWALEGIGRVQAAELMGGTGDNNFSPQAPYTREQSIITFLRFFEKVGEQPGDANPAPDPNPDPSPSPNPGSDFISLDKSTYSPGERMRITVTGVPGAMLGDGAWVALTVQDGEFGITLETSEQRFEYNAPDDPGTYRMYFYSSGWAETPTASVSFTVR